MKHHPHQKQSPRDADSYFIAVPIRIIYRLASPKTVIAQEEGIQPIEVDDRLIGMTEAISRRSGESYEKIILDFITETVAKRLANDEKTLARLKALAEKHQCNILTEVTLNGTITWPKQQQKH